MLLVAFSVMQPGWIHGDAIRYAKGKMGRVANVRGIEWYPCMVAYTYAHDNDMGKLFLLVKSKVNGKERKCLVVDLPERGRDKNALIRRGVVVELDYGSGEVLCGYKWKGKATECPVSVFVLKGATR